MYCVRSIANIEIDDLSINTANGYKIYKKGKDTLLFIDNQVFTDETRKFLLSAIRNNDDLYKISITETISDDIGMMDKIKTTFLCGIAEGTIYEKKYDEISNTLPLFRVINVYESEVE
jgi:hypothetical protein